MSDKIFHAVEGKRHVIWDWNGTLLDDVGHAVSVMNSLLDEHGLNPINRHQYRQLFEFPVIRYYQKLGFDFERESFEQLCFKFVDRFMAGFRELPLIPSMKGVLSHLHSQQLTQSVLSATDQPNLDAMVEHFRLSDLFRYVYGIDNKYAGSKVARGLELIEKSQIHPHETIIVGDTLHDLEVAQALGIEAVLISHGHQCGTRLHPHHHLVIDL